MVLPFPDQVRGTGQVLAVRRDRRWLVPRTYIVIKGVILCPIPMS